MMKVAQTLLHNNQVPIHITTIHIDKYVPSAGGVSALLVVDKSAMKFMRNSRAS